MKQLQKKDLQIKVIERQTYGKKPYQGKYTQHQVPISDPTVFITTTVTLISETY